ncbi:MAG TPA: hypothetical protein VK168_08845 [Saprospiraceae bacterium]|nr:hypothetical protein [Saprospiraceae bacterium]
MDKRSRALIAGNTLAFAGVMVINYLANALPLNGKNTGELSNQYPNLFTPAGLTFSIWGVIYLWLLVFTGVSLYALFVPKKSSGIATAIASMGRYFIASSLLNMAWIFAWHWEQLAVSVAIMIGLLASLVQLNRELYRASDTVPGWIKIPFGLYQGWITIALVANVTALLVAQGWRGGAAGETFWTVLMICAGVGIATYFWQKQRNLGHVLAVVWALLGIFIKRNTATEPGSQSVAIAAATGIAVLITVVTISVWKHRFKPGK